MTLAILELPDLISVVGGLGVVTGAIVGLLFPPTSDRQLLENMVLGAGLGLIAGTAIAFAIGLVDLIAGA